MTSPVISRREALKSLATCAAALALEPYRDVFVQGDRYTNERLGLSVRKPPGWSYSSVADFAALRERQVLQLAIDETIEDIYDPDNLPVFLFENENFREGEFAPGIGLYDEDDRKGALSPQDPDERLRLQHTWLDDFFARYHRNFVIHEEPVLGVFGGAEGALSKFSYLHEIDSGETHDLLVQALVIYRPTRVHTMYLVDSASRPCIPDRVWNDFMTSIQYRHK